MNWENLAKKVLSGAGLERDDALSILRSSDDVLLEVLQAAFLIRREYWGRGVRIHRLRNAKSGMCRENCSFCSQAIGAYTGVDRYQMQSVEELLDGARQAHAMDSFKYCIVTATRGPSEQELDTICEAVVKIKKEIPIEICTSLGLLTEPQAERLAAAGVDRFNHNLESSARHYPEICQTHSYEDRLNTLKAVRKAGMEMCCGGIMGMGETDEDRVDLAFTLQALKSESIPVNFLDPRPGTPLADCVRLTPTQCLRTLCMFRFVNPKSEIRAAGGREVCLKHLQPLALYPANSIFSEGYLTTPGATANADYAMIEEAGFYVEKVKAEEPMAV